MDGEGWGSSCTGPHTPSREARTSRDSAALLAVESVVGRQAGVDVKYASRIAVRTSYPVSLGWMPSDMYGLSFARVRPEYGGTYAPRSKNPIETPGFAERNVLTACCCAARYFAHSVAEAAPSCYRMTTGNAEAGLRSCARSR